MGVKGKYIPLWDLELKLLGHCPIEPRCKEYKERPVYVSQRCYLYNTFDVYYRGKVRYYSCKTLIVKRYKEKLVFGYTKLVNNGHTLCMVPVEDPWPFEPDKYPF